MDGRVSRSFRASYKKRDNDIITTVVITGYIDSVCYIICTSRGQMFCGKRGPRH